MFITPAFAQDAAAQTTGGMFQMLVPFALIFAIMYFLIIRPQQKRVKAHQEMVKNIRRGDTVVLGGGLIGKVVKVIDDNEVQVELGEGMKVRALRAAVAEVRAKGEPVKEEAK